jgi:diadenosine tetraphosphate (Ap4A) HIT family hydrolase
MARLCWRRNEEGVPDLVSHLCGSDYRAPSCGADRPLPRPAFGVASPPTGATIRQLLSPLATSSRRATMPARIDFQRLELRTTLHWTWQLHENQSFLGRLVLRLNRDTEGSIADLTADEWLSMHEEVVLVERWLARVFAPDRFNYAQLGNVYPRLHIHVVPRYRAPREWSGVMFSDSKWGRNWAPTPRSPLPISQTYELADWLRRSAEEFVAKLRKPRTAAPSRARKPPTRTGR